MKKRSKFLAMLLSTAVAVSSLTGISVFAADKTSGEEETRTVVDATGAEVEVPAHPKRIAVPAMVLPNMVYALQGNAENMVSIPPAAYSGWEMSILKDLAPELEDVDTTMVNDDFSVNVEALADADVDDIEAIVRPCGLGKSKARDISACMKMLRDEYQGHIPKDFDALLKLPGVGRKSANLIMGDVFGKPAIVTDTHCIRIVNRIGLVDGIKEPKKVEMALWKLVPPEEGSDFCHRLVYHGREVCTARTKPYCEKCCLQDICKKAGVS